MMTQMPPTNKAAISQAVPAFRNRFDVCLLSLAVFASALAGHVPASLYRPPQYLGEERCCV